MKNKILSLITVITFLTANTAYSMPLAVKTSVLKFAYAMAGVVISSLVIYFGLTLYNKFKENIEPELSPEEEILRTPKTKESAIRFYIKKNKLR